MTLPELADALQKYEFDMLNEQVASRLRAIHEQHRWIPVSERMPTEEDLSPNKAFSIWHHGGVGIACIEFGKIHVWYNEIWNEYDVEDWRTAFTHWQRITPPEGA
jgi:hypothetical protein